MLNVVVFPAPFGPFYIKKKLKYLNNSKEFKTFFKKLNNILEYFKNKLK